ncbi:MAG: geranylgeranyl reductase family protein [Ginsengibacter sp.]
MEIQKFDVVIVGAGPAGCAAAYVLSQKGLKIALIEKDIFPRDKICGDAFGADVTKQFHILSEDLANNLQKFTHKIPSNGVRFIMPEDRLLDIQFTIPNEEYGGGFVSKRKDFDNFFFSEISKLGDIEIFQKQPITAVTTFPDKIILQTASTTFESKIALGADGAHSILNKRLTQNKVDKNHYCAGVRQYFSNVKGFHPENHIELHFYKELLPGYLWVFPLAGNQANVGLGILSSVISSKKINLKEQLSSILKNHPVLKERFKDAVPLENIQGYGLPLGSKKRSISGNRFLLLGDAAGLIDPFTGEGIANAIRSGRVAAAHVLKAIKENRFDADFNARYDKEIYSKMWNEFRFSHSLQRLFRYPAIINFVVKKANKNKSVQLLLSSMLNNEALKKELIKPSFYFKLFFS